MKVVSGTNSWCLDSGWVPLPEPESQVGIPSGTLGTRERMRVDAIAPLRTPKIRSKDPGKTVQPPS
ncbi:MAG: hypothetical protein AAGD25_35630 [Cyanobacteria bacterium P01_F01_bin.150]